MALNSSENVDALDQIRKIYLLHGFARFNMQSFNKLKSEYGLQVPYFETYFSYQNGSWRLLDSVLELISMSDIPRIQPPSDKTSGYFSKDDENNPNYYFHGTSLCNFVSICSKGIFTKICVMLSAFK